MMVPRTVSIALLVAVTIGCGARFGGGLDVSLLPGDELLAREVVQLVEKELAQLPADHPVIERYGNFTSIKMDKIWRLREQEIWDLHYPAHLQIGCSCVFSRYSTPIDISVEHGGQRVELSIMQPSPEHLSEIESEYKPVQREDGLWFDSVSGSVHSIIECRVWHPEFKG